MEPSVRLLSSCASGVVCSKRESGKRLMVDSELADETTTGDIGMDCLHLHDERQLKLRDTSALEFR